MQTTHTPSIHTNLIITGSLQSERFSSWYWYS